MAGLTTTTQPDQTESHAELTSTTATTTTSATNTTSTICESGPVVTLRSTSGKKPKQEHKHSMLCYQLKTKGRSLIIFLWTISLQVLSLFESASTAVELSVKTERDPQLWRKLRWTRCGPRKCQMVRETNCIACLSFAQECLDNGEDFNLAWLTLEDLLPKRRHTREAKAREGLCFL